MKRPSKIGKKKSKYRIRTVSSEYGEGIVKLKTLLKAVDKKMIKKAMNNEPSIDWLLENQDTLIHKYYQMGLDGKI